MARQICQHIIGMNPQRIGDLDTFMSFEEVDQKTEDPQPPRDSDEMTLEEREDAEVRQTDREAVLASHEELVRQDFLLDPEVKVGRVLLNTGIRVVDFVRYEVGQDLD